MEDERSLFEPFIRIRNNILDKDFSWEQWRKGDMVKLVVVKLYEMGEVVDVKSIYEQNRVAKRLLNFNLNKCFKNKWELYQSVKKAPK